MASISRATRDRQQAIRSEMEKLNISHERLRREVGAVAAAVSESSTPVHAGTVLDPDLSIRMASLGELMQQTLKLVEASHARATQDNSQNAAR
ncbi:hypothetical protein M768_08905 [Cellulosimicrobium cellulans F16]|uniref:Uncharacterized protein n=1 Tax=Cellulosimicrobium cellulans F16 TaxID=1350482 RepID=A0A0M0F9S3_CELCE|nr:hypothetical protein M768_08905 [Cellulosimicrobium cellulans F16]